MTNAELRPACDVMHRCAREGRLPTAGEWAIVRGIADKVCTIGDMADAAVLIDLFNNYDIFDDWSAQVSRRLDRLEAIAAQQECRIDGIALQLPLFGDASTRDGWVYFASDGDAVKIGYTARDERKRRKENQTGNPRRLTLLIKIPGDERLEKTIQDRFRRDQRVGGGKDWYNMSADVMAFIRALQLVEIVF